MLQAALEEITRNPCALVSYPRALIAQSRAATGGPHLVVCVHTAPPSRLSAARADPALLRFARFEDARSRTTRRRRAGRRCKPVVEVTSPPTPLRVVALVLEPDRDAVASEAPEVLLEPVVELPGPLTLEERDYLLASLEELVPIAPLGVLGVSQRDLLGVAGVPGVPGRLDLLP